MSDLISIVVPVFNTPVGYVSECIRSIVNQTHKNLEIIIVNDGSESQLSNEYSRLCKNDSRISLIETRNMGVSHARNVGIEACNGSYISFVDSDDIIAPTFIETLYSNLVKTKSQISVCGVTANIEGLYAGYINSSFTILAHQEFYNGMLHSKDILGYLCNKLFKKELITSLLDESLSCCEDFDFCSRYAVSVEKAVVSNSPLYFYRQCDSGMTASFKFNRKILSLPRAYAKILRIYEKECPILADDIKRNILKQALNLKARYNIAKETDKDVLQEINRFIREHRSQLFRINQGISSLANLWMTYLFPTAMFKLKCRMLNRKY